MSKVVAYIDGSHVKYIADGQPKFVNGWSMILHHNSQSEELYGARVIRKQDSGLHEFFAFVECVLELKRRGYKPEDVSIYTDDQIVTYIPFDLHPDNYSRGFLMNLPKWKKACHHYFDEHTFEEALQFIQKCRINKVKGHALCVDNHRCDYLAKYAAWRKAKGNAFRNKFVSREKQLKDGFKHNVDGEFVMWYPPFCDISL